MSKILVPHKLSKSDLGRAVLKLSEYGRIQGYLFLKYMNFPVLRSIIITGFEIDDIEVLKNELQAFDSNGVVVRSDSNINLFKKPQGGFIYNKDSIENQVKRILKDNRIPFLLEPASRYDDIYSGNLLFIKENNDVIWEIVGPGFELGDISRGTHSPHEIFYLPKSKLGKELSYSCMKNHTVIKSEEYSFSWRKRVEKIYKFRYKKNIGEFESTSNKVKTFLDKNHHPLLYSSEKSYKPISIHDVNCVNRYFLNIEPSLRKFKMQSDIFVISFSFTLNYGLIFWDIFSPYPYLKRFK